MLFYGQRQKMKFAITTILSILDATLTIAIETLTLGRDLKIGRMFLPPAMRFARNTPTSLFSMADSVSVEMRTLQKFSTN